MWEQVRQVTTAKWFLIKASTSIGADSRRHPPHDAGIAVLGFVVDDCSRHGRLPGVSRDEDGDPKDGCEPKFRGGQNRHKWG
jgi:hypothetical protein